MILSSLGGIHKFIGWDKPLLTDSGGYQVYSLSGTRKIIEKGVTFQSHIDGDYHFFTPEYTYRYSKNYWSTDIIMALTSTPYPCEYEYIKKSMHMTHRWLKRCCDRFDNTIGKYGYKQTFFPIVQGSVYKDLRKQSKKNSSFNRGKCNWRSFCWRSS